MRSSNALQGLISAKGPSGDWFKFDDTSVTKADERVVLRAQAYMLFFEDCQQCHLSRVFFLDFCCEKSVSVSEIVMSGLHLRVWDLLRLFRIPHV